MLGRGIGFNKRPGDPISEELVEKVYYVQDEMQTKFLQMLQDVRPDVLEAAERIIAAAETDGFSMSNQATISLIDHISFAIERQSSGVSLPNLLLSETIPRPSTMASRPSGITVETALLLKILMERTPTPLHTSSAK